jgi:hypothetical protein
LSLLLSVGGGGGERIIIVIIVIILLPCIIVCVCVVQAGRGSCCCCCWLLLLLLRLAATGRSIHRGQLLAQEVESRGLHEQQGEVICHENIRNKHSECERERE